MNLKNTYELMISKDYKERFLAEYLQTKERYERLKRFNNKIEAAEFTCMEPPKHDCPLGLLKSQQKTMGEYLHVLEIRAEIEGVNLSTPESVLEKEVDGLEKEFNRLIMENRDDC